MEFKFSPEDEAFRQDLRQFVQTELPSDWEGGGRWPEESDWDFTRQMLKKLKVYAGPEHPHEAQQPEPLAL